MSAARLTALLAVLSLAACAARLPVAQPGPTSATVSTPSQLLAAVQSDADRIEQASDGTQRNQLLAAASASAQQCLAQSGQDAACQYAQAQVLGLSAREHPLQAVALLKQMLTWLAKAEGLDPALDHAGPARLSAVVLLRAPPWPLGPGDADSAVVAAQRAVKRDPDYPPNLITLAQAQAKSDGAPLARATFAQAKLAVQAWQGTVQTSEGRAKWQRDIDEGLHDLP